MSTSIMPRRRREPASPDEPIAVSIRFPGQVYTRLGDLADRERRSLAAHVLYIVERYLAEQPDDDKRCAHD